MLEPDMKLIGAIVVTFLVTLLLALVITGEGIEQVSRLCGGG